MEASFNLGRIRGIAIGVHYTWLIVFGLLAYSLARSVFPSWYSDWSITQYWVVGGVASLLLFASVVAHELGHSFVALSRGIGVKSITLFIFGGVATLERESEKANDEFWIAIAGPAVSVVVAVVSWGLWLAMRDVNEAAAAVFEYLALANGMLVGFNLIPGFPLDGGRVFRAIVWGITGSLQRATRVASTVGVIIGYLFIILGIFVVFSGAAVSGIWFIAIGWFLQSAAEQSYQQMRAHRAFAGVHISSLMDPNPPIVHPDTTLDELVDHMLGRNVRAFPVLDHGALIGIITLSDIRETPRERWASLTVGEVMTPRDKLVTTTPSSDLEPVLQAMSERDIHQVPVVDNGALVGLLTRADVIRFLQLQQDLRTPDNRRWAES
jgi:Zn-dependent protease/CBS domain-containing protein